MDIFTLHMIFGLLVGAVLGGMPVAVLSAPVLVICFAVFLFGGSGGSVDIDFEKRFYVSGKNDEARAGECVSRIPVAAQYGRSVVWRGPAGL